MGPPKHASAALTHVPIVLCADDYALSSGVCDAIDELAMADRLSATSAIVTLPTWRQYASRLTSLRDRIAIGLHFNLTAGAPLGPMPALAPLGTFRPLRDLILRAVTGRLPADEIAAEASRQIASFEELVGHAPDFIDGHQHVHALPGVRTGVLRAISARFRGAPPLVRDPGDGVGAIASRRLAMAKALLLATLAAGFGRAARKEGCPTNHGFAGVSSFDRKTPYADELAASFSHPGRRHLVMCHPGYPDEELAAIDPLVERRRDELEAIRNYPALPEIIWHVSQRDADGLPNWPGTRS